VISGFVFMSDQDCSEDYLATGPMVGTYFSHGFGVYSRIFGVIQLSTDSPMLQEVHYASAT